MKYCLPDLINVLAWTIAGRIYYRRVVPLVHLRTLVLHPPIHDIGMKAGGNENRRLRIQNPE